MAREFRLADEVSSAGFFRIHAWAAAGRRGFVRRPFLCLAVLAVGME
jgi:hypothetical protein